jgi:hypothetical protein
MAAAKDLLWFALEVSGYQDAAVAAMVTIGAIIIGIWAWGKPWLQWKIQNSYGRKKWTFRVPTVTASILTLSVLTIPTLYKAPSSIQIDIQESYLLDQGPSKSLFLLVNVHNMVEFPMVPESFQIRALEGTTTLGLFDTLPFAGKQVAVYPGDFPGDKTFVIAGEEFLENRLTNKPVTMGVPINGWLLFDLNVRNWRDVQLVLEFHDSFGKNGKLTLATPTQIPPLPEEIRFHRGVTYPFKEKARLQQ